MSGLQELYTGTAPTTQSAIYHAQTTIGWGNFFEGFWNTTWQTDQVACRLLDHASAHLDGPLPPSRIFG